MRPLRTPTVTLAAALAAGALIGAGGGAATYAALSSGNGKTVVRQVTVSDAQPASSTRNLSVQSIYRLAHKGVVEIRAGQGQGSGFVYDAGGHLVTNAHVVDGVSSVSVKFWNGKTFAAQVVGTDASTDLAVLKVDAPGSELFPLSLGDSGKLVVGDQVVAIGSPFGLEGTVTSGIVSALHREMTSPNQFAIDNSIQTDAAINHGNSGGPLLNAQGKVVGVNSQIESNSGGNEGVGFAIPSNTVRSIGSQLISSGKAEHAFLGVVLRDSSSQTGAAIGRVRAGTPAARAALRAGDVVTAAAGTHINSASELRAVINAHRPGDTISVTYTRGGKSHTVKVKLAARPA
ncbi:MAG: trypsin-like peptidase domain-containing protein [Actinomycetota bacterium]|nr:trypsin-like peptidase domain-containing protein [Actinomycetota bacterium]